MERIIEGRAGYRVFVKTDLLAFTFSFHSGKYTEKDDENLKDP
jgi:hypothetical protein